MLTLKNMLLSLFLLLSFSMSPIFANESEEVNLKDKNLELEEDDLNLENLDLDNLDKIELSTLVRARKMHKNGTAEYAKIQNKINEFYGYKVKHIISEPFETEQKETFPGKQYIVSGIVGTAMPFGKNLKSQYESGSNFGIRINTPIYFFIGPLEINLGGNIYLTNMKSKGYRDNYTLANLMGSLSTTLLDKINVRASTGLSPTNDGTYLSMTVDIGYEILLKKISVNIEPISLTANLHIQETLGVPQADEGSSEILGFSLVVGYPITF